MQPFGVVAASPFEVAHTENELKELAKFLKSFSGETKVVMEYTGSYYDPIARFLHNEGIYVTVVNAILIHNYSGNSVRKAKTDKKDSVRIAQYALDRWLDLREYIPDDEIRSEHCPFIAQDVFFHASSIFLTKEALTNRSSNPMTASFSSACSVLPEDKYDTI